MDRNISNNKIYLFMNQLEKIASGSPCFPICMEVHPTNVCQHNCRHCTSARFRKKNKHKIIEGNHLKNVLKQFADNGGKSILWTGGGDPALYHCTETNYTICDILEYTRQLGLKQGFYSNGEGLTDLAMKQIVKSCAFLRISLDAFSASVHKRVHGSNGYNKIVDNVIKCLEYKNEFQSDIDIGISYVVYDNNISDLKKIKSFLKEFPVAYLYIKPGQLKNNTKVMSLKQKAALILVNVLVKDKYGVTDVEIAKQKINNQLLFNTRAEYKQCFMRFIYPTLETDGCLYSCCHHVGSPYFLIGDTKHDKLADIFRRIDIKSNQDLRSCPMNCRGHIINRDIEKALELIASKHTVFL